MTGAPSPGDFNDGFPVCHSNHRSAPTAMSNGFIRATRAKHPGTPQKPISARAAWNRCAAQKASGHNSTSGPNAATSPNAPPRPNHSHAHRPAQSRRHSNHSPVTGNKSPIERRTPGRSPKTTPANAAPHHGSPSRGRAPASKRHPAAIPSTHKAYALGTAVNATYHALRPRNAHSSRRATQTSASRRQQRTTAPEAKQSAVNDSTAENTRPPSTPHGDQNQPKSA